jgi:hypothetical protein
MVSVYLKSNAGSNDIDGAYEQYEPSFTSTCFIVTVFRVVAIGYCNMFDMAAT